MAQSKYDQASFEDIVSVGGVVAKCFAALCLPAFIIVALGLDGFQAWLQAQTGIVRIIVMAPMWALSYVVIAGIFRGLAIFAERLFQSAVNAIEAIGNAIGNGLTLGFYGSGRLALGAVTLALHPPRVLAELVWDQGRTQLDLLLQGWREKQEMRRLYREEFRGEFRSYRDFERHFDNPGGFDAGQEQPEPEFRFDPGRKPDPPKPDAFTEACRLFGLPENGTFTQAQFKKAYHVMMRRAHPDAGGSNAFAAQINMANTLIKSRKGWS